MYRFGFLDAPQTCEGVLAGDVHRAAAADALAARTPEGESGINLVLAVRERVSDCKAISCKKVSCFCFLEVTRAMIYDRRYLKTNVIEEGVQTECRAENITKLYTNI